LLFPSGIQPFRWFQSNLEPLIPNCPRKTIANTSRCRGFFHHLQRPVCRPPQNFPKEPNSIRLWCFATTTSGTPFAVISILLAFWLFAPEIFSDVS